MDIKALAEKYEDYIIDRRRYYHAHPELSGEEKETRAQIHKDLNEMGISDIREMKDCYGLIATIHGAHPGKTLALRADIDALNVKEATGLPFASQNENKMHACGHDTHIAMALGAARILNDVKDELYGDVRVLFQPAEEIVKGSQWMIREGAMDGVDAVYGAHIWNDLDAPLIDVTPGARMASCDWFKVTVTGASAHAAQPHKGIDAIAVAAAIINNFQQYVSRMNNPFEPTVVTVGTINGGVRWSNIPDQVVMEGTARTYIEDHRPEKVLRRIAEKTAEALGAKATLEYEYRSTPIINKDPKLNKIAHDAVVKLFGEEGVGHMQAVMGGDDFSWLGEKAPYFFAFVGSHNEKLDCVYPNHSDKYNVDESVLMRGAAVMAQFSHDYLSEE